jgi:predicted nucleic acid-binding protein
MRLVDTSSWIEQLRRGGSPEVRRRVESLLQSGDAVWCQWVRLELWNGARGEHERKVLAEMDLALASLEVNAAVWGLACELAAKARQKGVTVPCSDILVAACARHHRVDIEHADAHFDMIAAL